MVAQQKKRLLPVKRNKKIIIGKVAFEVDLKVSFTKKTKKKKQKKKTTYLFIHFYIYIVYYKNKKGD